jgi:hypothetical protein
MVSSVLTTTTAAAPRRASQAWREAARILIMALVIAVAVTASFFAGRMTEKSDRQTRPATPPAAAPGTDFCAVGRLC